MPPLVVCPNFLPAAVSLTPNAYQAGIPINVTGTYVLESVAVSGDGNTFAVSRIVSPRNNHTVSVYSKNGTDWVADTVPAVTPTAMWSSGNLGISLSLSYDGNVLAIGANQYNSSSGAVVVLRRSGTTWVQSATIVPPVYAANIGLGTRVRLSADGNTIVSGASGVTGAMYTSYIFEYVASAWQNTGKFYNSAYTKDIVLSSDGTTICQGSGTASASYENFSINTRVKAGGVWSSIPAVAPLGAIKTAFGYELAISADGKILFVGASKSDLGGTDLGACYVYEMVGGVWSYLGVTAGVAGKWFGGAFETDATGSILAVSYTSLRKVQLYKRVGGTMEYLGDAVDQQSADLGSKFGQSLGLSADGKLLAATSIYGTYIFTT